MTDPKPVSPKDEAIRPLFADAACLHEKQPIEGWAAMSKGAANHSLNPRPTTTKRPDSGKRRTGAKQCGDVVPTVFSRPSPGKCTHFIDSEAAGLVAAIGTNW